MTNLIPSRRRKDQWGTALGQRSLPTFSSWIDEILNHRFGTEFMSNFNTGMTLPAVNVLDLDEKFLVEMAVPGFKKSDFDIHVDNGLLTISAETKTEDENVEDHFTRREFGYSSFQRTFTLPEMVNIEKIVAKYDEGILKVAIPKLEEAMKKPVQTVKVS